MIKVVFLCGLGIAYGGRHQIETFTNHLAVYVKNESFPALRVELTTEKRNIR